MEMESFPFDECRRNEQIGESGFASVKQKKRIKSNRRQICIKKYQQT